MTEPVTEAMLEMALEDFRSSPHDGGLLRMIVARPAPGERNILKTAELSLEEGLVGDDWRTRRGLLFRPPDLERQLTLMNVRVLALIAGDESRWALAGDQLLVDFDLSVQNLPAGAEIQIGDSIVKVSAVPHTGCKKFVQRFGIDAMKFVNSPVGRELNLRGINARVVHPGRIRVGDALLKSSS